MAQPFPSSVPVAVIARPQPVLVADDDLAEDDIYLLPELRLPPLDRRAVGMLAARSVMLSAAQRRRVKRNEAARRIPSDGMRAHACIPGLLAPRIDDRSSGRGNHDRIYSRGHGEDQAG